MWHQFSPRGNFHWSTTLFWGIKRSLYLLWKSAWLWKWMFMACSNSTEGLDGWTERRSCDFHGQTISPEHIGDDDWVCQNIHLAMKCVTSLGVKVSQSFGNSNREVQMVLVLVLVANFILDNDTHYHKVILGYESPNRTQTFRISRYICNLRTSEHAQQ